MSIEQSLHGGMVGGGKTSFFKEIVEAESRELIRRHLGESKPLSKPWVNASPWKRGRKAVRFGK